MSTFNLRNQNDALPETFNLGSRGLHDAYNTMPMAGAGEMRRGWESSGLGLRASELYGQSNLAETEGDLATAQALRMQADDLSRQASAWAPTTRDLTDVSSVGEFGDWVAGQAGNLRSSIAPMVGGGLGAIAGGAVGLLAKNPGLGARVGSYLGAGSQAVPMARDEIIAEAMNNPEIAAGRTAQEIRNTANIGGVVSGALDAVVPGAIAGGVATLGRKALRDEIAKRGVMGTIGMGVAKEAGEEALTEGAQSLVGQTAQNQLARNDLTDYDWNEAFNAAAGGAVGGGIMGGGGKAIEVAGNRLLSGAGAVADRGAALARDPGQVIGDAIADAGGLAGKVAGWAEGKLAEREAIKSFEQAKAAMESPGATDEQRAEILKRIGSGDFGNDPGILARPEDGSDPIEIDRNVSARAQAHAEKILSKDYENDFSQAEREAAARFKGGATDYNQFRAELRQAGAAKKAKKIVEQDFGPDDGTKQSRMITYERVPAHLFEVEAKKDPFIANMMRESGLGSDMAYKLVGLSDEQLKKLISEKTGIEFDTWKKWRDGATELANKVAKAREMDGGWTPSLTQRGEESRALADIWLENEGAKRPLFKDAGEDGRTLATKVVEWVRSGFGSEYDENGQFFIPTKLVDELGQDAAKVVREVADLVERQYGSFTDPDMLPKVIEQVRQRAMNNDGDNSFIKQMLTPLAAKNMTPQGRQVLLTMLRNLKGRPSKGVRAGLEEMFGTRVNDVLLHFTPKASEGRYGDPAKNGKGARTEDTEVVGIDENGELILSDDLSYGTKEDDSTYEVSGPELIGVGESNRAFDAPVRGGKKEASADRDKLDRLIQQMSEDRSVRVREVGVWDDIRQNLKGPENEKLRREVENDLISEYLPDWADELGAITTGAPAPGDLDELTLPERKRLLNMINQRFRFIVKEPNNAVADPGKLPDVGKGSVADYKFTLSRKQRDAGMTEADLTVKDGFIFLERNYGGRTSSFPVRTNTLLSKRAFDATSDSPVVEGQQGAAGINKQVLSMLSNIIFSGTGFTGRIGYRKEKGGEMHWLRKGSHGWVSDGGESRVAKIKTSVTDDQGNRVKVADAGPEPLPGETKLGKSGTVADAREQELRELRAGGWEGLGYAQNHKERVSALNKFVESGGHPDFAPIEIVRAMLKGAPATLKMYRAINQTMSDEKGSDIVYTYEGSWGPLDFAQTTDEMYAALHKLAKQGGYTEGKAKYSPGRIMKTLLASHRGSDPRDKKAKSRPYLVISMYRAIRNEWVANNPEATGGTFSKDVDADKRLKNLRREEGITDAQLQSFDTDRNIVPSEAPDNLQTGIRREDPEGDAPIQRNEDGAAQGFGTDAEGAGYGGNSRGGQKTSVRTEANRDGYVSSIGLKPSVRLPAEKRKHSEPANTSLADSEAKALEKLKALNRLETWRDGAVETLNKKGLQGLMDIIAGLNTKEQIDTLRLAVLGRTIKKTDFANVSKTSGVDKATGLPMRDFGKTERREDRVFEEHTAGIVDFGDNKRTGARFAKLHNLTPREGIALLKLVKENAASIEEALNKRKKEIKNGEASRHGGSAEVRPTDTRGQDNARGAEAGVAEGNQRQRADGESGLGTSGQGQQPDAAGRGVAEQLKAYLDQHGSKNAVWANVSRKALASGDQKQVAGALAAARKQFGELPSAQPAVKAPTQNTINVYWGAGENKELSNLAPRPFEFEGRRYRSVEHAYQSLKSGEFDADAYARGKTVAKAPGRLGTKTSDGWNVQLMKRLMKASFEANPSAAAALKATGDAQITHNQDRGVWKELFPKLLMEVRSELSTPSENRADTGSTTPASANLVDLAKPPAFAREKELAKLDGADFIFAPLGVQGSFASRLAQAAKDAGKLIDPNGTENIRDKVVYISVPGASRKFEGMDAFLADIRKLLDRGAIIRTDTKEHASRAHNAEGEGRLRTMLALMDYNLTEGQHYDSWQKNLPASRHKKGVVGDAAVATPTSGPGSMQQPHSLPMSYKIYNIEDIRPELRSKYKPGDGIAALIPNGDRTATTRNPPAGVKVGHIIKFPGVEGLYRVTGFEKIDLSTPAGREKWSKREGWDVSMTGSFGSQVRTGATQMLFERVDSASTLASTGDDSKQAKRDAFVFKIANMSMKDMRAYVDSIPDDKLSRAYDVLDTFYPVDNTNPFWQRNDLNKYSDQMDKVLFEALDRIATRLSDIEDDSDGTKFSKQSSESSSQFDKMTPEQQREAEAFIQKVLADTVDLEIKPFLKYNASGSWKAGKDGGKSVLSLAMNSNIVGTAYHESLHEFFNILLKHGAKNVQNQLTRVATSPMMIKKLERLLEKHPDAIEQLKDPEEALAYMFQFYQLGALKLGPETKGIFQRVWDMLRSVAGLVSERIREENKRRSREGKELLQAKAILDTFASGAVAKVDSRQAVIDGLKADVERHEQAMKALGETWIKVANTAGKLVMSAEAMMDAVGDNPYVHTLARWIHQKAGTEMRELHGNEAEGVHGAYLQGVRGETNRWMNKLENILTKYSKEDLELARQALSTGTPTYAPAAAQAAAEIKKFYEDMYQYMDKSDVRRLEKGRWVRVQPRKDYGMTQVWDVENVVKNRDQFKADLLQHHMKALERIAAIANNEARDFDQKPGVNTAADIERKRVLKKFMESGKYEWQDITPEMVADAIIIRLVNSGGKIDIEETESNLGITPLAAAVNRRTLDWLNMKVFDKYLSKDVVNIMSTYTRNMVKRAEYQKRFGYGGERLRDKADEAVLYEMGGKELVIWAHDAYPNALEAWKKALAKHMEDGGEFEDFGEPKPTLRSVGQEIHARKVGAEQFNKDLAAAVGKLEQVFKAVQAVEGTLGNDMNPTWRAASSWLITYQNLTKLSLMLFNSMTDVMGIVVNGGELGDAWNAFTTGMREIRNSYVGKKGGDELAMRAEEWGAVDASSLMDSLGQTYGSTYMTQRAKRISDAFFKYTGAEGWNRGVRMVAANVGERIITKWAKQGIDLSDPAKKAQFERLFGKDADPKDIKLDAQGRLDITDARNQAAVQRWVLDSVMAPNAATRPIWGSNPNFAIMMHLKNFTYTFHRIMLKGVIDQAALGNYRPVLVLATGYVPIMIASHAIKEMLIPGEEPPWMKNGLDSYLEYGWDRAGLLGVPQMYADVLPGPKDIWNGEIVKNFDPAALAGPSVDQLQDFLSIPLFDHKTLLEEGLQALPGGNVLQRLAK